MSVYTKSWLGLVVTLPLFFYLFFGVLLPWMRETHPPLLAMMVGLLAVVVIGNGIIFGYNWFFIKCPNCGIGFGPKMYRHGLLSAPWPRRECWKCGADMRKVEEQIRLGLPLEPVNPTEKPAQGFPLSFKGIFVFVLIWNTLGLLDRYVQGGFMAPLGQLALLPLLFLFLLARKLKTSARLQEYFLHEGHGVNEIKELLCFFQLLSGFMLFVGVIVVFGSYFAPR